MAELGVFEVDAGAFQEGETIVRGFGDDEGEIAGGFKKHEGEGEVIDVATVVGGDDDFFVGGLKKECAGEALDGEIPESNRLGFWLAGVVRERFEKEDEMLHNKEVVTEK